MCFSAEASFAVGGALLPAAAYCARAAWVKDRRLLPVALMPLAFGVQQCAEGVVWLGLHRGDPALVRAGALPFLFFALAFWPLWLPLTAACGDARPPRRRAFALLAAAGIGWFVALYLPILTDPDRFLSVRVVHHSILYAYPDLPVYSAVPRPLLRAIYLGFIVAPLVLGPNVLGRLPGAVVFGSAVLAAVAFEYAFISVWCFFAAGLALCLCAAFYRLPARAPAAAPAPHPLHT